MLHLRALELNDAPVTLCVVARKLAQWPMHSRVLRSCTCTPHRAHTRMGRCEGRKRPRE